MPAVTSVPVKAFTVACVAALLTAACSASTSSTRAAGPSVPSRGSDVGIEYENTGTGPMVAPTVPVTPSVPTETGGKQGNVRTFTLTASQFTQQIANFPLKTATVWGYNNSTPGPTLIAYAGEQIKVIVNNKLPEPTTMHFHGLHQPNEDDGVAGISQPTRSLPAGPSPTGPFLSGTWARSPTTPTSMERCRTTAGWTAPSSCCRPTSTSRSRPPLTSS